MSEFDYALQVIRDFVVYGIAANLLVAAVSEIVGDKVRFKVRFYKKKLSKWLGGLVTEIRIFSKPVGFPSGRELEEIRREVREYLTADKIQVQTTDSRVSFSIDVRGKKVDCEISRSLDNTSGAVEGLELQASYPIDFRGFSDGFIDLVSLLKRLEKMLSDLYGIHVFQESLQFIGLKKAFELNGVLRSHGLESLSTTKAPIRLDFADNEVTLSGPLDSQLKNLLQDIITYYY